MATTHKVQAGDCISSIAFRHGFRPETLWMLPENAKLRERRQSMFQLVAGEDEVFIPDLRPNKLSAAVDKRHRFRRKGVPERLQLRFEDESGKPRSGLGYELESDGRIVAGETDDDGRIVEWIRPDALRAKLVLYPESSEDEPEVYDLMIGRLAPIDSWRGQGQRLHLLGFLAEAHAPDDSPGAQRNFARALSRFQRHAGLADTGEPDATTLAALDRPFAEK